MTATRHFRLNDSLHLEVNGVSAELHPYVIEITSPQLSLKWAKVLSCNRFQRYSMGRYPFGKHKRKPT